MVYRVKVTPELWGAIKDDEPDDRLLEEIIQVAAMCFRYVETGDRYRGPAPFAKHLYNLRIEAGQVPPAMAPGPVNDARAT